VGTRHAFQHIEARAVPTPPRKSAGEAGQAGDVGADTAGRGPVSERSCQIQRRPHFLGDGIAIACHLFSGIARRSTNPAGTPAINLLRSSGASFIYPTADVNAPPLRDGIALNHQPSQPAADSDPIATITIAIAPSPPPTTRAPFKMCLQTLVEVYSHQSSVALEAGITMRMFYLTVTAGLCAVASCAWAGVNFREGGAAQTTRPPLLSTAVERMHKAEHYDL
jgi:hypothetical protein